MRRVWRALAILALLALPADLGAAAATRAELEAALRRDIARDNRATDCTLTRSDIVHQGALPGEARPVTVLAVAYEGCGGGNMWVATFAVYVEDGKALRALPLASMTGLPAVVERVRVAGGRVVVEGMNYGPDDGRCCPSVPRQQALVIRDGRLVAAR